MNARTKTLLATLYFLAIPLLLFGPTLLRNELVWGYDFIMESYWWRQFTFGTIAEGHLPLWNPYLYAGFPFFGDPNMATFFLPNYPLFLLFPPHIAIDLSIILSYFVAGLGTYLFARRIGLGRTAALFAGTLYELNAQNLSQVLLGGLPHLNVICLFPLVLAAYESLIHAVKNGVRQNPPSPPLPKGGSILPLFGKEGLGEIFNENAKALKRNSRVIRSRFAWLAFVIFLIVTAGHFQFLFYAVGFIVLYLLYRFLGGRWTIQERLRVGLVVTLSSFLGFALSLIQIVPFLNTAKYSFRTGGLPAALASDVALAWPNLVGLLSPNFFGNPFTGGFWGRPVYEFYLIFTGAIWLTFFFSGVFREFRRSLFFLICSFAVILFSMGNNTPFFGWVTAIVPFAGIGHNPARVLFLAMFSIAIIATFAIERLDRKQVQNSLFEMLLLIVFGILVLRPESIPLGKILNEAVSRCGAIIIGERNHPLGLMEIYGESLKVGTLGVIFTFLFFHSLNGKKKFKLHFVILCVLTEIFLFHNQTLSEVRSAYRCSTPERTNPIATKQTVGENFRYATHSKIDLSQVPFVTQFKFLNNVVAFDQAQMNMGILTKTASYNSGLALYSRRLMTLMRADCYGNSIPTDPYLLSRVSVKSILDKNAGGLTFTKPAQATPIPILSIAGTTHVSDDDFFALGKLWSGKLSNDEVIVKSKNLKPITSGHLASTVDLDLTNRPNGISAKITTDKPGMVNFRENFYPGWHATVDGRPAPIYLTDYAFMGVPVDAGKHLVSFAYMPLSFVITILLFIVTALSATLHLTRK